VEEEEEEEVVLVQEERVRLVRACVRACVGVGANLLG